MKNLNIYILEKFKITKDINTDNGKDAWYAILSSTYNNEILNSKLYSDKVELQVFVNQNKKKYAFFFTKKQFLKLKDKLGEVEPGTYRLYYETKFTELSDAMNWFTKTIKDDVNSFYSVFTEIYFRDIC